MRVRQGNVIEIITVSGGRCTITKSTTFFKPIHNKQHSVKGEDIEPAVMASDMEPALGDRGYDGLSKLVNQTRDKLVKGQRQDQEIRDQPATKLESTNQLQPESPRTSTGLAPHTVRKRSSTVELEVENKRVHQSATTDLRDSKRSIDQSSENSSSPGLALCINKAESESLQEALQSKKQVLTENNKADKSNEENEGCGGDESSVDIESDTTEADTTEDETAQDTAIDDSAFGNNSEIASCISTDEALYKSKIENGRQYQDYSGHETLMPDDEIQRKQLDMAHRLFLISFKEQLHSAPIKGSTQRVLDLGTGTGIWAIDFADRYPSAHVIGLDLVPMQPEFVPPNCEFVVDDIELPWNRPDSICDFVHIRCLNGSIKNWPKLLRQSFMHLKPGAWIEHVEISPVFQSKKKEVHSSLMRFSSGLIAAGEMNRKTMKVPDTMKTLIMDAGFTNTINFIHEIPFGSWAQGKDQKDLGILNLAQFLQGLDGFILRPFTSILGYDFATTKVFLEEVREVIQRPGQQLYCQVYVAYGQKAYLRE